MRPGRSPEEDGASAVEYGLLVAGIAAVVLLLVFALGGFVKEMFQGTCDAINQANTVVTTTASCTP